MNPLQYFEIHGRVICRRSHSSSAYFLCFLNGRIIVSSLQAGILKCSALSPQYLAKGLTHRRCENQINNLKFLHYQSPKPNTCGMTKCSMNGEQVCAFTVEGCLFFSSKNHDPLKKNQKKKKKRLKTKEMMLSNRLYQKSSTLRNMVEKQCHWNSDLSRDWSHPT